MDITKQLTELFGDIELSEDVLIKMKLMMEKAIQEKTDVLNEEISKLNTDIKTLHENAEAYGIFLQEKADEYGNFLQEKADAYGKFLQENAESYGTFLQEKANDYGQYVIEEMTDNIDNYTGYVVEKFIEENKSALLEHNEYERMKSLFENVKIAFEENNFKLSENYISNTDEIKAKLEESTKSYNELYSEFVKTKKNLEEMQYSMVFENVTKDLADTQKERINNLVKNVSFSSIGEFKRGVELMVEEVVASSKIKQLNEVEHQLELSALANEKNPVNDKMQQYLNHL